MTTTIINLCTQRQGFVSEGTLKVTPTFIRPELHHLTLEDDDEGQAAIVVDKASLYCIIEELQKHLDEWGDE